MQQLQRKVKPAEPGTQGSETAETLTAPGVDDVLAEAEEAIKAAEQQGVFAKIEALAKRALKSERKSSQKEVQSGGGGCFCGDW